MSIILLIAFSNTLSVILPLLAFGLSLALVAWVWLEVINRGHEILYAFGIDILELTARRSSQVDDHLNREVQLLGSSPLSIVQIVNSQVKKSPYSLVGRRKCDTPH